MAERRSRTIQVRVSDEEYEQFQALAAKHGMSVSETLRELLTKPAIVNDSESALEAAQRVPAARREPAVDVLPAEVQRKAEGRSDAPGFKRLVAQIQGKKSVSQVAAEEEARKRLGME